ncbi:hypothetical protein YC2023_040862 [Brassica napus]
MHAFADDGGVYAAFYLFKFPWIGFFGTLSTERVKTCVTAASGQKRLLFFYVNFSHVPVFRTLILGSKESEDEESDDDWPYEGDTRVEVDEDDMSDDAVVSGELMIYKDTDEEGEHGAVEQTRSGSGPGEAGSGSAPSSATTGSNSTVVGDSVIGGSVANSSASGVASVAGSSRMKAPRYHADSCPTNSTILDMISSGRYLSCGLAILFQL